MRDVHLRVKSTSSGWRVDCDLPIEPTCHASSPLAEKAARAIALHLSEAGHDVRVVIQDGHGQVVSTQRYFAPDPAPAP